MEGVKALLANGADPSKCSEAGWSALTFAAHKGYEKIVKILLEKNAPVNCKVIEDSSTPLHKACAGNKVGHLESCKLLLENGANVHALNKWKETPLLTAANNGQTMAVKSLLEFNADSYGMSDGKKLSKIRKYAKILRSEMSKNSKLRIHKYHYHNTLMGFWVGLI